MMLEGLKVGKLACRRLLRAAGAQTGVLIADQREVGMKFDAIVRTYIRKRRSRAQAELDCFRHQPSVGAAIEKAALAVNCKGKRFRHQRRLQKATLGRAQRVIQANSKAINGTNDFDELHSLIDRIVQAIHGIGPLYVYDTSLRIGAKLNRLPTKVYLHAGTRVGARALGLNVRTPMLEVSAFPPEFHVLEPHEIEDVLCIFKNELKAVRAGLLTGEITKRSWCS